VAALQKADKKRKSMDQLTTIARDMPEHFEEYIDLMNEAKAKDQTISELRRKAHAATESLRIHVSAGAKTIV